MNISCKISFTDTSNFFSYSACNDTAEDNGFKIDAMAYMMTVLLSFPINFYVIWLIVRGTGNGLAAEFFTLNFCVCEIMYCIECLLTLFSYKFESVWGVVEFLEGIPVTGRPLFQCLICVERYLAVVHPVIFLKFKLLRYRLMCSAGVWVMCLCSCIFTLMSLFFSRLHLYYISYFAQFFLFLSIQLFCCLAVLRALKQSGPGERGREREKNNLKRRAFYLILITTVTTVIIYSPQITVELLNWFSDDNSVILQSISYVFFLFAGLVQPLLFLYRVGKLNFIKCH